MRNIPKLPKARPLAQAPASSLGERLAGRQGPVLSLFPVSDLSLLPARSWRRWRLRESAALLEASLEHWLAWAFLSTKRNGTKAASKAAVSCYPFTATIRNGQRRRKRYSNRPARRTFLQRENR